MLPFAMVIQESGSGKDQSDSALQCHRISRLVLASHLLNLVIDQRRLVSSIAS